MNNFAKDYWNQITILRERARKSIGNINFKVFGKEISWRRSSFEHLHLYLIPWLINVISLTTLATTDWLKIPGTDITVPLLQLAGIPIAMQWARKYSRKIAKEAENDPELKDRAKELHELADRYEKEWQKIVGPFSRFANWIKGAIDARLGVSAPEIDNLDLRTKPHLVDPPETGDDDPTPWLRSSECEKALSKRSA